MALGKPDITKFDSDDDSIKDARPEMQTAFTSLNTMIDEYNTNGETFGQGQIYPTKRRDIASDSAGEQLQLENGFSHVIMTSGGGTIDLAIENFAVQSTHYITLFPRGTDGAGIDTTVNIYANNDYTGAVATGIQIGDTDPYFFIKIVKIQLNDDSAGGEYSIYAQTDTYDFKYSI
jgi:hypothetical protein